MEAKEKPFKTIGDVALELNLPPHVLRFWESKFFTIKPHKRRGGHRYYSTKDINRLQEIKTLLYERGFTIKGAQKYLKEVKQLDSEQNSLFANQELPEEDINLQTASYQPRIDKDATTPQKDTVDEIFLQKIIKKLNTVNDLLIN